jgi:PAS domain S-box-containing protein
MRWVWVVFWACYALCGASLADELEHAQGAGLAGHKVLRVGVVLQPPYAHYDRRLRQLSGAHVDLINSLVDTHSVELKWRTFPDLQSLEAAREAGQIDVAPGLLQTPAALRQWLFTDPYVRIPHLLVGERTDTLLPELEQMTADDAIAVTRPSAIADYLRSNYPNLTLLTVFGERQTLDAVIDGRARYAALNEARFAQYAQQPAYAGLAIVGDVGSPLLLRIASRSDWPELADALRDALAALPAKTLDDIQRRWLKTSAQRIDGSAPFWRSTSLLLGLLLLSALALLIYVRRQVDGLEKRLLEARQAIVLREAAEKALRLTQFSIDHSSLGILWVNWDSHIRYANRSAEQLLGHAPGELEHRPLIDYEPDLHMDRWLRLWKEARLADRPLTFETQYRRIDGVLVPVDISLSFLHFREAEYLVVFLSDVTERRRARAALEESQARLRGIAANVPGLVFRIERSEPGAAVEFAYISEGSESLVGYPAELLMSPDRGLRSIVHPEDRAGYHLTQDAAFDGEQDWQWQGRILTRRGAQRWADIRARVRHLDDGKVVWDGIVWDISENKQVELELADSRAQLRELSAHLETVREEEKARIAREVHDELGQVLTVLKLETSMCELAFGDKDPALQERLQSMKRLIAQLFQLIRDVATALRPPILDAGIASAIEWQVRRFEARTQIPCLVDVPEHVPQLTDAQAIGLFRVLQEALTNVMRHAQAHSVRVTLGYLSGVLKLTIVDDGQGFDPEKLRKGVSFGLVGMRERVSMMGGHLELVSRPDEGARIEVTLDIKEGVQT